MTAHTVISENEADSIRLLFSEGIKVGEISRRTGWPKHRVMAVVSGTARIGDSGELPPSLIPKAEALRRQGYSYREIAIQLDTQMYRVRDTLSAMGYPRITKWSKGR